GSQIHKASNISPAQTKASTLVVDYPDRELQATSLRRRRTRASSPIDKAGDVTCHVTLQLGVIHWRNEVSTDRIASGPRQPGPDCRIYRIGRTQSAGSLPNFSTRAFNYALRTGWRRSGPTGTVRLGADARQRGRLAQILTISRIKRSSSAASEITLLLWPRM